MKSSTQTAKTVRLIARIWGSIILAFILMFVLAHLFGDEGLELGNISAKDKINFIFFPISTIVGLGIAYKYEFIGGLITILGMIGLFYLMPELLTNPYMMIGIIPPGILYMVYWYLSRKKHKILN